MPYINVNDAYILDNTGKQVDDAVDYALANSNRNLLDNPWFTVNQRLATTVTLNGAEAYIADRWIAGAFGTYTRNSDGTITITVPSDGNFAGLTQRIDPVYKGGTYTYSLRLSDDTIISLQGTMPNGSGLNIYNITINGTAWQALFRSDGSAYWITLRCNVANATLTVKAAKLELGSYSTLANDVPPDYAEELAKCQRYFWRLGNATYLTACIALAESATQAFGDVILPVPMRAQPSVQTNGTFLCYTAAQSITITSLTGNALSYPTVNPNRVALRATVASGLTIGTFYNIQSRNNAAAYIDFSADL